MVIQEYKQANNNNRERKKERKVLAAGSPVASVDGFTNIQLTSSIPSPVGTCGWKLWSVATSGGSVCPSVAAGREIKTNIEREWKKKGN